MRQSYKLRLGDGTVLVVDHAGLGNWLTDRRALVQPAGQELWTPLRSFLIQEQSAARRAARHRQKTPSSSRDALPLVYPKPLEEPAPAPPVADDPARQPLGAHGDPKEPAKEPIPRRADGLPLIPPPEPRDAEEASRRAAPASPATVVPPPLVPPPLPTGAAPLSPPARPAEASRAPSPLQAPPLPPPPRVPSPPAPSPLPSKRPDEELVARSSLAETPPAPRDDPDATLREPVPAPPPMAVVPSAPSSPPPAPPATPSNRPDEGEVVVASLAAAPPAPALSVEPAHSVPPIPVETRAEREALPALVEPPTAGAESASPSLLDEEDVGWMTLQVPVGDEPPGLPADSWLDAVATPPVAAPTTSLEEARRPTRSRALSALGTLVRGWIDSVARLDWNGARLWLTSRAASARRALVALWESLGIGEQPRPSSSLDAANQGVSERVAPPPLPPVGAPPGERAPREKIARSPGVYRPRRSTDGLPLLQLEPLEDDEAWASPGGSDAQSPTDDLPEVVLEPLDERPGRRTAELPRLEKVAHAAGGERDARRRTRDGGEES